ncbi:M48 family metallopeptidase [Hydrogenobacter thermophilus]|uniref:M48 metallopeptidase family protein n=1 Tax=Hydrogenobacter thermophilus TaxID=940 RepID=UPI0030FCB175
MKEKDFKEYVKKWATVIGVSDKVKQIQLRKMTRKLASCSSKGRLTFNIEVLKLPEEEIKKIVVHELLHLRYPNHGKLFKAMYSYYLKHRVL